MSLFEALGGGEEYVTLPPWERETTDQDVRDIRRLYTESGWLQTDIAEHFGISQSNVSRIINHKRRKDVT